MTTEELILTVDDLYAWNPEYAQRIDNICDKYGVDIYTAHQIMTEQD